MDSNFCTRSLLHISISMAGSVKHNCLVVDEEWVTIIMSAMFTSKASLSLRLVRLVSCANSFNRVIDIA